MPTLKSNPSLIDIQAYVEKIKQERGFTSNTLEQECLLLGEEIGELFKAIRKHQNMRTDARSNIGTVEEELADVLIYMCAIASQLGINLEQALRGKERINQGRVWKNN